MVPQKKSTVQEVHIQPLLADPFPSPRLRMVYVCQGCHESLLAFGHSGTFGDRLDPRHQGWREIQGATVCPRCAVSWAASAS